VQNSTLVVGSLDALRDALGDDALGPLAPHTDVVVVPTAAAFVGAAQAAVATAEVFDGFDVRIEALMVTDRASNTEPYFVERLVNADLVVLCDGSPLHARTVWRNSPVGDAINAARSLVAIGAVSSVLGDVMIDPRGGAPTSGLGHRIGVAFCAPASTEQLDRTRSLLATDVALVVLGRRGVVQYRDHQWRVLRSADVVVTRGSQVVTL